MQISFPSSEPGENEKASSLGLPAVNEPIWRKDRVKTRTHYPRVTRVFCTAGPMFMLYVALSLLVPGGPQAGL